MKQIIKHEPYKKCWLSLHFYQLPLEVFTSYKINNIENQPTELPFAIIEKSELIYCNLTAQTQGLSRNMKSATAYALCSDLKIKERNPSLEKKCLLELANIAYEFSSHVCLYNHKTILLEISGSCKLFLGLANLLKQINNKIKLNAISFYMAIAETPKQAFLLSIYNQRHIGFSIQEKNSQENYFQLKKIPIDFIAQDVFIRTYKNDSLKKITLKIRRMGIKTLGELFKLPEATLGRRFGSDFLTYLYRLKGQEEDPLKLYSIADSFSIQRCFLSGLDSVEQILFPAKPMLESLVNFLTSRRKMASKITWRLECFDSKKLTIDISLSSQVQSTQQLTCLTRLKLQQICIKEKIEMIFLEANDFLCKNEKQKTLELTSFANIRQKCIDNNDKEDLKHLKDQIGARLKAENYFKLLMHNEHLPEKRSTLNIVQAYKPNPTLTYSHDKNSHDNQQQPLWLMNKIEKINIYSNTYNLKLNYRGLLTIQSSAERIENHWWKKNNSTLHSDRNMLIESTCRDYFMAKNQQGICYWIFSDRHQCQWFVHGVF